MSFETIWVKVRADMTDFNRKMQGMQSNMQKVGQTMKSAGTSMTLGLTAPILLFGTSTLKAAGNFEAGMNRVQAVSGATEDEFKKLSDQAKRLGANTQFSATQAADAMGFLAMAGMDANEVYNAMPDTLNLAASAQIDMGSSADIVTNILTGMQVPMEELPHVVDVMAKAFTSSNTDLVQLGQGMKFVGPVASSFGVKIETTTAALGLLSNAGMQAGMAGTGFRKVLTKLVSEQKKLGVQTLDSAGKLLPLADIIDSLKDKSFSGAEAMEIFGDRGGPAMINLLSAGGDEIRRFTALLDDAGGTAKTIADVQMQGLNGAMKELRSAFEAFQIALAESGMADFVGEMAKSLAEFFRGLTNVNPALLRMATAVIGVTAVVGPLILVIGTVITAAGAMLGPISLVVAALGALAAAGAYASLEGSKLSNQMKVEKLELNNLVGAIQSANATEENRLELIVKMQEKYPDFLSNIDAEAISNNDLQKALVDVNKQYDRKIINLLKEEALDVLRKERIELQLKELDLVEDIANKVAEGADKQNAAHVHNRDGVDLVHQGYQNLLTDLKSNRGQQDKLTESIDKTIAKYDTLLEKQGGVEAIDLGDKSKEGKKGIGVSGTSKMSDAIALVGLKAEEARTAQNILAIEIERKKHQSDFFVQLRAAVAIRQEELDLLDKQKAAAEAAHLAAPTDETLAALIELNTQKLEIEQRFSDDIGAVKKARRDADKEMTDLQYEEYLKDYEARKAIEKQKTKDQETEGKKRMALANAVGNAVSLAMNAMGESIAGGLRKSESGFKRFLGVMVSTVTKLISMMLSSSIANAIAGATASGTATGPGAVFATPAFIATAVGGVMAAFTAIPKFAKGGLVGSPMLAMVGDNPNAKHDPEVISPLSKLKGMIQDTGGGAVEVFGVISGEDIYLSSREYERKLGNTN